MKKALKWLDINFEPLMMSVLFFAMTTLITVQVILRFVFKTGFAWGEEVSRYLFVWLVFMSIPYAARNNRHIGLDFIRELFPEKVRKVYMVMIDLAAIVMFGLFLYNAGMICYHAAYYGDMAQTLPASVNWMHAAAVVGYAMILVREFQCLAWKLSHFNSSYELFCNASGRYSGATKVFFMPADQKAHEESQMDASAVEEEKNRKNRKRGELV